MRTVVITGSSSGIGRAYADLVRETGDRVLGVDLRDADICADLGTTDGRREAIRSVLEHTDGAVDVVVVCAGVARPDAHLVGVNYFGAVQVIEGLHGALARSAAPRAAVVSSIEASGDVERALVDACDIGDEGLAIEASRTAIDEGRPHLLYPSSKAALERWVRRTALAPGWADVGITLNAVAPGVVLTPMTAGLLADPDARAMVERHVPMPLNGHAAPDVVARVLDWVTGGHNTHVTGHVVPVDGGAHLALAAAAPHTPGKRR